MSTPILSAVRVPAKVVSQLTPIEREELAFLRDLGMPLQGSIAAVVARKIEALTAERSEFANTINA